VSVWVSVRVSVCGGGGELIFRCLRPFGPQTIKIPKCAETSTKTFMLQIAVSRRPMAKLKIKKLKIKKLCKINLIKIIKIY
jgi:hypothetical protein